jgi:hypothetical protein
VGSVSVSPAIWDEQLSPRDLAVVASLAELRFLSARQLERWHYSGATPLAQARAARRGLARLTSLGVLTRLERRVGGVRSGSAGYVYALDLFGQRIAERHGWLHLRRTRRLREPGRIFVRHALAVGELHIRLIEAARSDAIEELLIRQSEPACWRSFTGPGGSRLVLKPDSFVVIATALEWSWFVEVDQDTEGSAAIERKLAAYISYWRSGLEVARRGVQPRTLFLAPSARRVAQLSAAVGRLPLEAQPLFAVAAFDRAIAVVRGDE